MARKVNTFEEKHDPKKADRCCTNDSVDSDAHSPSAFQRATGIAGCIADSRLDSLLTRIYILVGAGKLCKSFLHARVANPAGVKRHKRAALQKTTFLSRFFAEVHVTNMHMAALALPQRAGAVPVEGQDTRWKYAVDLDLAIDAGNDRLAFDFRAAHK